MNDIVTRQNTNIAKQSDNPFADYADSAAATSIVGKLLKFSKGDWLAGKDEDEVPTGTKFVANMGELLTGWQRWEDNKPTDMVMGKVMERFQAPRRNELGDMDKEQWEVDSTGKERDPWQKTNYLLLKGANDGELYTFTTSSKGGLDAVAKLCKDYAPFMATKPNEWPVIEIGHDSYAHPNKDFGRIKVPTFKIIGFASNGSFQPDLGEQQLPIDDDANVDEFPEVEAKPAPKPAPKKNRI